MPNIVLKDRVGTDITYENVQQIVVKDTNGNYVYYSLGGGGGGIGTVTVLTLEQYDDNHQTALATITSPEVGDMAIIRAPITNEPETSDLFEFTAYVYTEIAGGENYWQPMDGNYSMDNVFLGKDLLTTTKVGFIESGTTIAKGTSMKSFVQQMLQQRLYPTTVQPSFDAVYNVSATSQAATADVQGAVVTPKLTVTFNSGSYTYGPTPTGSTFTEGSIDGTARTITSGAMSAEFSAITLSSSTSSYSKPYTYTYTDGLVPKDNLGDDYPSGKIIGASSSATATGTLMSGTLSVTVPTVSISNSSIASNQEVGTYVTPTYTITINNPTGSYPYGYTVGTKGSATSAELSILTRSKTVDGTTSAFSGNTDTGSWPQYTIGSSSQSKSMSVTSTYSGSDYVPVSQYGNAVPYKQIVAGTATKTASITIPAGMRQIFWGYTDVKTGIDSGKIRLVAGQKKNAALVDEFLEEDATAKAIIIAAPTGTRTLTSVKMPSSSMADVTSQFVKQSSTVQVEGKNGYTAVAYDLWVYAPSKMGGTYQINMA